MTSNLMLAPRRVAGRFDLLERRLRRYDPRFQATVRALAARHSRIADLAVSFPALLFALAVPRRGLDPAPALARVVDGAGLAEAAAAAELPMWTRKLPPEAFARPIARLPDGELFRRRSQTTCRDLRSLRRHGCRRWLTLPNGRMSRRRCGSRVSWCASRAA
jgi:hypothetical protein